MTTITNEINLSSPQAIQILAPRMDEMSAVQALLNGHAETEQHAFNLIPPRLKIAPGGTGFFVTDDGEIFQELTGVIALSQKAHAYWPERNIRQMPPLCMSPDGVHGLFAEIPDDQQLAAAAHVTKPHPAIPLLDAQNEPFPDTFACARCPLAKWGSTHQNGPGKGKACKELRRLILILDGFVSPVILTLPPTSCRPYDQYASGLAARGFNYFGVRATIKQNIGTARGGEKYGIAEFSVEGYIEDMRQAEAVIAVREAYAELVQTMPVEPEEYNTEDVPF
ncbi:hypothetical protein KFU94_35600 [Chloroflexi bacterium TSY]|nr:hypothetical protein [Chloroflexi bacterium TSY]